jgi:HAD superfamily hydrolase (TIGR01509 family)
VSSGLIRRIITALAFDVDGTIADTDPVHGAAWARALRSVTGRTFTIEGYLDACIAGAMSPREFISKYAPEEAWHAIEREKRRIYPGMLRSGGLQLTAGITSLLTQAEGAAVSTVIVSSSSRESVDTILQVLWTAAAPTAIVTRGDSSAAKPDPAPYLAALERLHVPAECVAAFEDSPSGIASATTAGLFCIQVGGGGQSGVPRIVDFTNCMIEANGDRAFLTVRHL